jgi:hypothetical protein
VPHNLQKLNQQDDIKKSYKWLNYLPRSLEEEEIFWREVYEDVIKLGEILKKMEGIKDGSP